MSEPAEREEAQLLDECMNRRLVPGRYQITVSLDDVGSASGEAEVTLGETRLDLQLK